MKWMIAAAALACLAVPSLGLAQDQNAEQPPKVGDKAPDFKMVGTDGKEYSLSQYLGKSAVVIAWYPKALTGG